MTSSPAELRAHLTGLMERDRHRLGRQVDRAAGLRDTAARERSFGRVLAEIRAASDRVQARRLSVPGISFPPELPVSERRDDIAAAIRGNQVVIVAGETGSGKTTQLPKICLELGRGITGQIGHTQPRRIAARTVADRIAAELATAPGTVVGHKVRFADTSSDGTLVKVMTDGILLSELRHDRRLLAYDTLIIDEAHERSLNIDFILGYLTRLLPSRPELKVVITSATIDPGRFSSHFGGAPVIEVSGRTYPVQVRYRPLAGPAGPAGQPGNTAGQPGNPGQPRDTVGQPRDTAAEPRDQVQAIADAVAELRAEGPGDILVFLSGEREIRDTADALAGDPGLEVLPLYARLSSAEQHRVFQPHRGRRVVLATNVAETSLTVPGIRYVIDPGMARISRYSHRTKVQRLPIEPVSRASANQRKGRCGRTCDGICIRLYSEEDFASRPEFTDPEIVRTSLASVILQMEALDLGEVTDFPFIDPPDPRQVADGVRLLEELGALSRGAEPEGRDGDRGRKGRRGRGAEPEGRDGPRRRSRLTDVGRGLARLPVDPRLGRMILEAGRNGCADEVLIITAALSIVDPRERPADSREAADAMHARFAEPGSDFLAFLHLWDYLRDRQRELSASALRRMCRREYLHYLRVREWQDVYGQLRQAARDLGIATAPGADRRATAAAPADPAGPASPAGGAGSASGAGPGGADPGGADGAGGRLPPGLADRVHMSLLTGLLSHVGMQDTTAPARGRRRPLPEFAGARGARFAIFPDSALAKKPPQWVIAAELVETSRLWARTVARIEPEWAEPLAAHLVKRTYSEPHWDARRGAVMASEKVALYGLPLVAARPVNYGRVDPAAAREMFITHALVEGDWRTHHRFFHHNRRLLEEAGEVERKARRRGIVVDDAALFAFYDQRIPAHVTSARHFDSWWKKARTTDPGLLTFSPADLVGPQADAITPDEYPGRWAGLPVSYEFAPGEPGDGVSVDIPLAELNQVSAEEFGWQVPGMREELVTELIRSLPRHLRKAFVPAPQTARAVLPRLRPQRGDLLTALAGELGRLGGVSIPREAWDPGRLPAHLRVTFRVMDGDRVLATGKDLDALRARLRPRLRDELTRAAAGITRRGLRSWGDLGTLPEVFTDGRVRGYPALVDAGDAADVALFDTREEAAGAMWAGTRRLLLIGAPSGVRPAVNRLPVAAKLAMSRHPYASPGALLDDCVACAADQVIEAAGGPSWDAGGFARLLEAARSGLPAATSAVVTAVAAVLAAAHEVEVRLSGTASPVLGPAFADIRSQLSALVYPGFVSATGARRLGDVARYLRAIIYRLEKMPQSPARDAQRMAVIHRVTDSWQRVMKEVAPVVRDGPDAAAVGWMIEELRVSLFAQSLGTPVPVSERRIEAALDRLTAG